MKYVAETLEEAEGEHEGARTKNTTPTEVFSNVKK